MVFIKNSAKKEQIQKFIQLVRPRLETITFLRESFIYLFEKPIINKELIEKNMSSSVEKTILDFIDSIKVEGLALLADSVSPTEIQDRLNSDLDPEVHFDIDQHRSEKS